MTRQIIDKGPIRVNTFSGGDKGECVQFTTTKDYEQMTREEAICFLRKALYLLIIQVQDDKVNPPWWQTLDFGDQ
jgi:hypothetical protein